eukprot:233434_1
MGACTSLQSRGDKQCKLKCNQNNIITICHQNSLSNIPSYATDIHCCDVTIHKNTSSGWHRITEHKTMIKLYKDELTKQYCISASTAHTNRVVMNCVLTSKCVYGADINSIQTLDVNDGTNRQYGWYGDPYDQATSNFRRALTRIIDDLKSKDNWMLLRDYEDKMNNHFLLLILGYVRQNEIAYDLHVPTEVIDIIWKHRRICGAPEWEPNWYENKIDFRYLQHDRSKAKPTAHCCVNISYDGYLCKKNDDGIMVKHFLSQEILYLQLGQKQLFKGLERAILYHMRVGSNIKLWVPSELAYGSRSNQLIPANSNLLFDISLNAIKKGGSLKTSVLDTIIPERDTTTHPATNIFDLLQSRRRFMSTMVESSESSRSDW